MFEKAKAEAGAPAHIPQLPLPPYPMGVIPEYTRHTTPIALRVRERKSSFTGDDFAVKDAVTGNTIFDIRAKVLSLHQKKTVHDHSGRPLFEFGVSGISIMRAYVGKSCDSASRELFHIKTAGMLKSRLNITFSNVAANGREEKWVLKGKWLSGSSQITTEAGVVVASISRDYANAGQILFGQQTYMVTVAPGVDASLITAICICLDESYSET